MRTIKAQVCSWSSQNIPRGFLGLKAVRCGTATLPGSCAWNSEGNEDPSLSLIPLLPLPYSHALSSRSRGAGAAPF